MESELGRKIQVALSSVGARMFRNNSGIGWVGNKVDRVSKPTSCTLLPGDVLIHNARPFHAGLCVGSSDYIGFNSITVTPEMVGKHIAVFVACEVKTHKGLVSEIQRNFIAAVRAAGGVAFVARSPEEAIERLKETK